MRTPRHLSSRDRSTTRRILASGAAILCAAAIAAGCGGDEGSGTGASSAAGLGGDNGALSWLPADTWLVASANLDPAAIDEAVTSLRRLPIWAVAEGFLPASDGKGLRTQLLEQVAKGASEQDDAKGDVTAKQLEAAFGVRAGFAITSNDLSGFEGDGDDAPVAAWIEVDDRDAAEQLARDLATGTVTEESHEGVDYLVSKDDGAIAVRDDLLLFAASEAQLQDLIDVHEGDVDESLAGDEEAAAVLEAGVGDALAGFALQSDPLLEAIPGLVQDQARQTADDGEASSSDQQNADRAADLAKELGPLLTSKAVDGLVADWIGGSITIDDTGLRMRGAWSNPRKLATPDPGSRELVERAPIDAPIVQATVSDGSSLGRVQDVWAEVRDAYDLDLRALAAKECDPGSEWACDLGVELALTVLEDEGLAEAQADAGDTALLYTQDPTSLFTSLARSVPLEAGGSLVPAPLAPKTRLYEFATPAELASGWTPSSELVAAARAAGISIETDMKSATVTVRVVPTSPLGRELRASLDAETAAATAMLGIDPRALLTPAGLVLRGDQVDDLVVWGIPQGAPSQLAPSLKGDADVLADDPNYAEVVAALDPPDEVGAYAYIDLAGLVEGVVTAIGETDQDAQRIVPTVRNNLADIPGILQWSAREQVGDEQVGTYDVAIPILE